MISQPFKYILIVENILGIYRNYLLFSFFFQKLVIFRTIVEIALLFGSFYFRHCFVDAYLEIGSTICYYSVLNVFSFNILILPIYHANNFKKLLLYSDKYMSYFPRDHMYFKNTNRKKKILKYFFILYIILKFSSHFLFYVYDSHRHLEMEQMLFYVFYFFEANIFICYQRVISQFIIIYCSLFLIAEQIDCIVRSISEQLEETKQRKLEQRRPTIIEPHFFVKWSAAYGLIEKISKLCNVIFGLQVTSICTNKLIDI